MEVRSSHSRDEEKEGGVGVPSGRSKLPTAVMSEMDDNG